MDKVEKTEIFNKLRTGDLIYASSLFPSTKDPHWTLIVVNQVIYPFFRKGGIRQDYKDRPTLVGLTFSWHQNADSISIPFDETPKELQSLMKSVNHHKVGSDSNLRIGDPVLIRPDNIKSHYNYIDKQKDEKHAIELNVPLGNMYYHECWDKVCNFMCSNRYILDGIHTKEGDYGNIYYDIPCHCCCCQYENRDPNELKMCDPYTICQYEEC